MEVFKKNPNVEIERKSDTKVILRDTVTKNNIPLHNKTDIDIAFVLDGNEELTIDHIAKEAKVDKSCIIITLDEWVKREFISNISEEYIVPE
jgi:hypothetical protein